MSKIPQKLIDNYKNVPNQLKKAAVFPTVMQIKFFKQLLEETLQEKVTLSYAMKQFLELS